MDEYIGLLKVVVVQGKSLAVRDFRSSDPYVIVKLGKQTAKTKVINSCLDPFWNEELTFSVDEHAGILEVEVFDKDRFKTDDKMGHTHLDLHPIVTAARMKRVLPTFEGEIKMRKEIPRRENCLVKESFVTCLNDKVVQDVWLRLCDVESGELELKLIWIEIPATSNSPPA